MLDDQAMHHMPAYSRSVRRLAKDYRDSTGSIGKGLYDILSAGVTPGKALRVLEVSAKAAKAGRSDTATAVDGITTILNAYQFEAERAASVSDLMFTVVKDGKITFQQLAENIGTIAPTAKAARLELVDLAAVIATAVKVEKPERAMTAIRAAIMHAAKEGESLLDLVKRFEGKNLEQILAGGLAKRAATGIALLAGNYATLREEMKRMRNSAGATEKAFAKIAASDAFRHGKTKRIIEDLRISIGQALLPVAIALGDELDRNEQSITRWMGGVGKSIVNVTRFVAANRELVIGLGKTAAAVGGVIVLGPPLLTMLKATSVACLFLAKNPLMLAAIGVAAVVAAFLDWDVIMKKVGDGLGVVTSNVVDLAAAHREATDALRGEQAGMQTKAERLVELRNKQSLTNVEMLEARGLAYDLKSAYPELEGRISALGRSAEATADFFKAMNEEMGRGAELQLQTQLGEGELELAALKKKMVELGVARMAILNAEHRLKQADPLSGPGEDFLSSIGAKSEFLIGKKHALENQIKDNTAIIDSYKGVEQQVAEAADEVERLMGILYGSPGSGAKAGGGFFDGFERQLSRLPGLIRQAASQAGKLLPEVMRADYREKNAGLLHNLKSVNASGIADELQRETEQIRLAYEQRIAVARKAGQDVKLLEMARDKEIVQARAKAESSEAEKRLARAKSLSSEISRLWISTTKKGIDRELALLAQAKATDLATTDDAALQDMIRRKYDLLGEQARQQFGDPDRPSGRGSVPVVERGFLTRAPGRYDSGRESVRQQKQIARNTSATEKALGDAIDVLQEIAVKVGIIPQVANF